MEWGKETPFNQDRNKLLLAVKKVSDLRALRECKLTEDAVTARLV